jgi:hypothetical protein
MKTFTPETTKILTTELNVALEFVNGIFPLIPLARIVELINAYNLDASQIVHQLGPDNGRMVVPVAADIFFVMSWYRFETGTFEIVCYATSNFDDYEKPFTAVYKAQERAARLRRLNSTLRNLPPYFNGKGHAFACVENHIISAGFDHREFQDDTTSGKFSCMGEQGRIMSDISNNAFIVVTWYKMPSGNYEIIAYAS